MTQTDMLLRSGVMSEWRPRRTWQRRRIGREALRGVGRRREWDIPLAPVSVAVMVIFVVMVVGWMLGPAYAEVKPMEPVPPWKNPTKCHGYPWATITASQVNMREGPGLEYDVVAQWGVGTAVEVVQVQGNWAECLHWAHLDRTVWICMDYLAFVEEQTQ